MNTLTAEQLDLLKRLQPKLRAAMGEWPIPGDEYAHPVDSYKVLLFTQNRPIHCLT